MAALEAVLAGLGVLFLVIVAMSILSDRPVRQTPVDDLAAPYREGLHAAVRMQKVAADMEQQIYAEAARHLDGPEAEGS